MTEFNQFLSDSRSDTDNLQQIKGIDSSTAEALSSLGIHRFSRLAEFTPNSLAYLLKEKVPSISAQQIEQDDWLGQARALSNNQAETEAPQAIHDEIPAEAVDSQAEATGPMLEETLLPAKAEEFLPSSLDQEEEMAQAPAENWRGLADFLVSFGYAVDEEGEERLYIKGHHVQADQSERWAGLAAQELLTWMLTQADLPLPVELEPELPAPPADLPSPAPVLEETLSLELSDLWVSQVRAPAQVGGQQLPGLLQAKSRLSLSGPAAIRLSHNRLPFKAELYLVNTQTNQPELIASQDGHFTPAELDYEIQQDFTTPAPGRYQLHVLARLLPPGQAAAHIQGPIIRVEA